MLLLGLSSGVVLEVEVTVTLRLKVGVRDRDEVLDCESVPDPGADAVPHSVTLKEEEPDLLEEELLDLDAMGDAELVTLAVEDPEGRVLRDPDLDPDGLVDRLGDTVALNVRRFDGVLDVECVGEGEFDALRDVIFVTVPLLLREARGDAESEVVRVVLRELDTDAVEQGETVEERLLLLEGDMLLVPHSEPVREAETERDSMGLLDLLRVTEAQGEGRVERV